MQEKLTYSLEDSLASHTAYQGSDLEKQMTATSGRKCLEQFEKLPHAGSWAKTFTGLLIGMPGWYSRRCRLTWKMKGTKYKRIYFQLSASMRPTSDTGFGLLPTVQTQGLKVCDNDGKTQPMDLTLLPTPCVHNENGRSEGWSPSLLMAVNKLLPTPLAKDYQSGFDPNGQAFKDRLNHSRGVNLAEYIQRLEKDLLPTPIAQDVFKATKGQKQNSSLTVEFQVGGDSQLNNRFVGEMMGFPVDWCELPFLHGKDVDLLASDKQKPDLEEKQLKPTAMP